VTRLRKVMLEELQRRNFSSATIRGYLGAVQRFARYFDAPPDRLGPDHIRQWQAHLLQERKLAVGTVVNQVAGLRFFFRRTLKRRFPPDSISSAHRATASWTGTRRVSIFNNARLSGPWGGAVRPRWAAISMPVPGADTRRPSPTTLAATGTARSARRRRANAGSLRGNQIEVLPLSSMDDGIRIAAYRTIFGKPGLDRYAMQAVPPIHIIVNNGKVTPRG